MHHAMTSFTTPRPEVRTVLHAGRILLGVDEDATGLSRYLAGEATKHLVLVHHGQPALRRSAREAGVEDVKVAEARERPEDAMAADLAVALDAQELEFAIDRPALQNQSGRLIGELTVRDAENYASDPALRDEIRDKLIAGCDAIRRGVSRVRIGNPAALLRDRATVIVTDPTTAFDVALDPPGADAPTGPGPDVDPLDHPLDLPNEPVQPGASSSPPERDDPRHAHPLLMRSEPKRSRLRYSPLNGCEFGPRRFDPFPDSVFGFGRPGRRAGARTRSKRPLAQRA